MRTAITLGITEDGESEIIHPPSTSIHAQRREFNELGAKKANSKFAEIQLWESGRGLRRRLRLGDAADNSNVNFNAAHLVENQTAKGKKKQKLPDLTPSTGTHGAVNFNAAHPVEKQQAKGKKGKPGSGLPDLNKAQQAGADESSKKQGVNFDAAKSFKPKVEKPGIGRVRGPKRRRHRASTAKLAKHVSKKDRISAAASTQTSTETALPPAAPPADKSADDGPSL